MEYNRVAENEQNQKLFFEKFKTPDFVLMFLPGCGRGWPEMPPESPRSMYLSGLFNPHP